MSLEKDFCSPRQYRDGLGDRINRDRLRPHKLYVVMFDLISGNRDKQAGKRPGYVTGEPEEHRAGFYSVPFTVVNTDPEPDLETVGTFYDGVWEGAVADQPRLALHGIMAFHAYFRRFSRELDADLKRELEVANWDSWLIKEGRVPMPPAL